MKNIKKNKWWRRLFGKKNKPPTIPVVSMNGVIGGRDSPFSPALSLTSVADILEKAFGLKKSPAVAIVINSPGGSPVQSHLIHKRIRDLAKQKNKKVHIFIEDAAASGGYMIACAGDDITADPLSITGSIGVIYSGFGFVNAIKKVGVERRVHTAGKNKAIMDPFMPEKKEDIKRLKQIQKEIHDVFINLVKNSRGKKIKSKNNDVFSGQFWTAEQAIKLGLIDEIGELKPKLRKMYGQKIKFKHITPKKGFFGGRQGISANSIAHNVTNGVVNSLEEKALWARLGL